MRYLKFEKTLLKNSTILTFPLNSLRDLILLSTQFYYDTEHNTYKKISTLSLCSFQKQTKIKRYQKFINWKKNPIIKIPVYVQKCIFICILANKTLKSRWNSLSLPDCTQNNAGAQFIPFEVNFVIFLQYLIQSFMKMLQYLFAAIQFKKNKKIATNLHNCIFRYQFTQKKLSKFAA